jgi:hypothetical protein
VYLQHVGTANPVDPGALSQVLRYEVPHLVSQGESPLDSFISTINERHGHATVGDQGSAQSAIVTDDIDG